jgi:hypothetical protein
MKNKGKKNSKNSQRRKDGVFHLQKQMPVGFPKTNQVKLRYVDTFSIDPAAGAVGYYKFRANSAFDPDYTGTGHQPNGFDQWSQFYNHYLVTSAVISVQFTLNNLAADSGSMMICGVSLTDDITSTSSLNTLLEQSQTQKQTGTFTLYNNPRTVTARYSPQQFFNVTDINDNWARLGAVVSSSPNEEAYFSCFVGCGNSSFNSPAVNCMATIEYVVMFSEPKELPES